VKRLAELLATALAGAIGSVLVVLLLGASLTLVVPVTIGVGLIFLAAGRQPRRSGERDTDREPQNA
jgi:uncharacterized membrane protein YccC